MFLLTMSMCLLCEDLASTPTPSMPTQSPASTAIPRLVRPPQVLPFTPGRPSTGAVPQQQLQQQTPQLSQQQLQQWYAQQLKAYQQRQLEQQIFAQQQNYMSQHQQPAFSAAPQYERDEGPAVTGPFYVLPSDTHHALNAQEMLMQQMLQQQMYEAALAQQQQQMKATVSAGAINLIQHQTTDSADPPPSSAGDQSVLPEADQLTAIRRASEGQMCTTSTTCAVSSVPDIDSASQCVTSMQSQSGDSIPPAAVTTAVDISSSQCHDDTFKVPFPPDDVCY